MVAISLRTLGHFRENPKLEKENYILRTLSTLITEKMKDQEINLCDNGLNFEGDLIIENPNYE